MNKLSLLEEKNSEASKFQCRLFGLFYEDLIIPILEREGYEIHAGKRDNKGIVSRPKVYSENSNKPTVFDYLLEKDGNFFLVEAKCWPLFHPAFDKKMREAIKDDKTEESFGLNPLLWEPDIEVVYENGKSVTNPRRVLLFWKIEQGEESVFDHKGVKIEVWPIYDRLLKMIQSEDDDFKRKFYEILNKYKKYTTDLFDYFEK